MSHPIPAAAWLALTIGGGGFLMFNQLKQEVHDTKGKHQAAVEEALKETAFAGQRGEVELAKQLAKAATEKYGNHAAVWVNLGVAHRAAGEVEPAIAAVKKAIALQPDDWGAIAEHATLLKVSGKEDLAMTEMERIPAGRGQVRERLVADPAWRTGTNQDRLNKLKVKHQALLGDTGLRRIEEMEKRREEFRQANKLNPDGQ